MCNPSRPPLGGVAPLLRLGLSVLRLKKHDDVRHVCHCVRMYQSSKVYEEQAKSHINWNVHAKRCLQVQSVERIMFGA